jgi:hypothetical protein
MFSLALILVPKPGCQEADLAVATDLLFKPFNRFALLKPFKIVTTGKS